MAMRTSGNLGSLSKTLYLILLVSFSALYSREDSPTMKNISRFEDDRIAFHYVNNLDKDGKRFPGSNPKLDPSLATLLIIKQSQTYIFQDGHDSRREVMSRIADYQRSVGKYRTRQAFIKEFRDIQMDKNKWESQPEEFRKGKDQSEARFHSIFQKYDSVYKTMELDHKKAQAEEYRQRRFSGIDSPGHKKAKFDLEAIQNSIQERSNFLKSELNRLKDEPSEPQTGAVADSNSNAGSNSNTNGSSESEAKRSETPLEIVSNPGELSDKNFYTNHMDGQLDYISYSRSPRTIDWEKKDQDKDSSQVQEKYGKLYEDMVTDLLKAHRDKFLFHYNRKAETGSRVAIEENPVGLGKRYILVTGDRLRYVLEDWDGDGIAETWEVSNPAIPFHFSAQTANIISITNCQHEKICSLFADLVKEIESGASSSLGEIKNVGSGGANILGNEDELLRDWDKRIREIK